MPTAPGIATPSRSHCTLTEASDGFTVPGRAVSSSPTWAVPVTPGPPTTEIARGAVTVSVSAETALAGALPVKLPVTTTEIFAPTWASVRTSVRPVAPATGAPSASHW
ncbi:unannotated protein [freshwater metagenome]|uniref:Unannotated protein n=1 Tax=freshwater metagenome TaxID=449393 RepID=A0A6J6R7H6_9ZZZZ